MVEMGVRATDPAQLVAHQAEQGLDVLSDIRTRIDQGDRVRPDDIGVGAGTGHHARVGRGDAPHARADVDDLARANGAHDHFGAGFFAASA
jgi:hypothetical protein